MMNHTKRDLELLRALVFSVRILSEEQILRAWWPESEAGRKNGKRRLKGFCEAYLLLRHVIHAKQVSRVALLHSSLACDAPPDFSLLSRESKRRWQLPVKPIAVYTATKHLRNALGGGEGHRVHALAQVSHDLGVGALFLQFAKAVLEPALKWKSEDDLPASGFREAQPDAVLVDGQGRPVTALEFAADYEPSRFAKLHDTFVGQQLPYQIWTAEA